MNIILEEELEMFKAADSMDEKVKVCCSVLEHLKDKKIVIYGAGAAGTAVYHALKERGIPLAFFVDRKYSEIRSIDGAGVYAPEQLADANSPDYLVIISVDPQLFLNFKAEITKMIEQYCDASQVVMYGRGLIHILKYESCAAANSRGEEFDITRCIDCGAESRGCEVFEAYLRRKCYHRGDTAQSYSQTFGHSFFGYIMGQACTLKCANCCEMVPYMKTHEFVDADTVISECRKVAGACDFLMYIELVGGEPFLHPKFEEILKKLLKIENVGYIKTFTNGTVVPSDSLCEVLQDKRLVVTFSNYTDVAKGKMLENIFETRKKLDSKKIPYIYSSSKTWLDFRSFAKLEKGEEKLVKGFGDCFIANCHRLYQGILYRCPHQYAGVQLGTLALQEGEYVDIRGLSREELAEKLDAFEELPYIDACRYCRMPYDAPEIPAALQLDAAGGCQIEGECVHGRT